MSVKLLAFCYPKEEKREEFVKIALNLVPKSRKDDGCIQYDLCQNDKEEIFFIEEWRDKQMLNLHAKKQAKDIALLNSLSDKETQIIFYETMNLD